MIVILNQASGSVLGSAQVREEVEQALGEAGVSAEIWPVEAGTDLPVLLRRAVASPAETIVAAGGDGTINAVGGALVGTGHRLGVLPMGTLNHFARDLGLPVDLPGAARALAEGHEVRVDVGEVNGRYFLNNSSLGLYPRIVRHREAQREQLGRGKWLALSWAFLRAVHLYPSMRLQLRLGDELTHTRSPFLFIGNNAYHMDLLRIGKRDRLDEGELSVYFARGRSRWSLLGFALRTLVGRVEQAKNFETRKTVELLVELRRPQIDVSVDGEVCRLETPLRYRIHPRALRVIGPVPATP